LNNYSNAVPVQSICLKSEITDAFAKIERLAEGCDLGDACLRLRLVKRAFFAAYHSQSASKSTEILVT